MLFINTPDTFVYRSKYGSHDKKIEKPCYKTRLCNPKCEIHYSFMLHVLKKLIRDDALTMSFVMLLNNDHHS